MSEKIHRNALPAGHQIHWYRLERVLGQGGFGITYLAHDGNLDCPVAVKEYLPVELAVRERDSSVHPASGDRGRDYQWGLERFVREARTLAKFDHPNIVRVLSVFAMNNTAYMVMRYEVGKTLQQLLPRGGTLEEQQVMKLLMPILDGLGKVHDRGFIHRDIKPGNILVRTNGSPVLLDFGSVKNSLGAETRTVTSVVSPGYAPFEQYYGKGEKQGPWTDVYALGATLYRCTVGVAPIDALDRSTGFLRDDTDQLRPASVAAAGRYSKRFLHAIDHALEFKEENRPQTVADWSRDFEVDRELSLVPIDPVVQAPGGDPAPGASREPDDSAEVKTILTSALGDHPAEVEEIEISSPPSEPVRAESTAAEPATSEDDTAEIRRGILYRCYIGADNTDYYLDRFRDFDAGTRRWYQSWHWPAALMTIGWLLYRRLYLWVALHPIVTALASLPPVAVASVLGGGDVQPEIAAGIVATVSIFWPGLFGNLIYYSRARALIARMDKQNLEGDARHEWLRSRGGTSKQSVLAAVAVIGITVALIAHLIGGLGPGLAGALVDPARVDPPTVTAPQSRQQTPLAENPPTRETRISRLLAAARNDIEEFRYSSPPGHNAVEKLRRVLDLDPGNRTARRELRAIVQTYAAMANQSASRGEWTMVDVYLARAMEIAPRSSRLREVKQQLDAVRVKGESSGE